MRKLVAGALAAAILAVSPADAAGPLDGAARKAVVEQASAILRRDYVYPDTAEKAAAAIETAARQGAYDSLADPEAFAHRLTADLQAAAGDKHLRVVLEGEPAYGPDLPPPPRSQGGVVRADRLAGNIGYLEVVSFLPDELFGPALDQSMEALKGSRAVILDLRRNIGGDPAAVSHLVSSLLPPTRIHINDLVWRTSGSKQTTTQEFWSTPGQARLPHAPVLVLTSGMTFSGGEEAAYDLQALKRAVIVGETTSGGANPGDVQPLPSGFSVFVPTGAARNPVTHANWEGTGVKPEVSVPAADALRAALGRLGVETRSGDIAALSRAQVFAPRSRMQPGSRLAVARLAAELAAGAPRYERMTPGFAELTRAQLPRLQALIESKGALRRIESRGVNEIGMDAYTVTFEKGVQLWSILLAPDGRTALAGFGPG